MNIIKEAHTSIGGRIIQQVWYCEDCKILHQRDPTPPVSNMPWLDDLENRSKMAVLIELENNGLLCPGLNYAVSIKNLIIAEREAYIRGIRFFNSRFKAGKRTTKSLKAIFYHHYPPKIK